jgi:hypothetical protein
MLQEVADAIERIMGDSRSNGVNEEPGTPDHRPARTTPRDIAALR